MWELSDVEEANHSRRSPAAIMMTNPSMVSSEKKRSLGSRTAFFTVIFMRL